MLGVYSCQEALGVFASVELIWSLASLIFSPLLMELHVLHLSESC